MGGIDVTVVGGGSWGTAFATVLADAGHRVRLAVRDDADRASLRRDRENVRYLPGESLPETVDVVPLEPSCVEGRALVVLAVPSRAVAEAAALVGPALDPRSTVLSLAKGLEPGSGRRLSTVIAERAGVGSARVAVLSGPTHAEEVVRGAPAAAVVAAADVALAAQVRDALGLPTLRLYANPDLVGVELCGAAKNVIALAAGISDGLGHGDNAKAALLTRGLAELARLGAAFGADARTFAGLAGLGDLVATCCSPHGRNRRAGELLARGVPAHAVEGEIGMVVEGLATAPTLRDLAARQALELPITERVCAVLDGEPPSVAVEALMARGPGREF